MFAITITLFDLFQVESTEQHNISFSPPYILLIDLEENPLQRQFTLQDTLPFCQNGVFVSCGPYYHLVAPLVS